MPIAARRPTYRSCPSCPRDHVAALLAFVAVMLVATVEPAQDTTGVGAVSGTVVNAAGQPVMGVQNVTNRRNFASYSWNRRTNAQQFGEQQGIFPILGLDWRF